MYSLMNNYTMRKKGGEKEKQHKIECVRVIHTLLP